MVVESWIYLIVINSFFLSIYKFTQNLYITIHFFDMKIVGYTVNFNNT